MLRTFAQLPKRDLTLVLAVLVLPCVLMIVSAALVYDSERGLTSANGWVKHTGQVIATIQTMEASLAQTALAQRSYLLTQRSRYLEAYHATAPRLLDDLRALRALTADNAVQQRHLDRMEPLVRRRLTVARNTIMLEQTQRHEDALAMVLSGVSETLMESIHDISTEMMAEEQKKLTEREARVLQQSHRTTLCICGMVAANLLAVGGLCYLLRSLRRLRGLVHICAWSRTVEYQGEWISFEKYLHLRFGLTASHGISPEEAAKVFDALPKNLGKRTAA